ncbi:MAG: WbqC family protein [Candidatus Eremiobacteraeota bacterium]|nr:WbqC family protein [Candidatus Eremiobacteraeota bacterium]
MTIGILQPGYLPWLGFFEQLYRSDLFVIYDDVTFDKGGWRNRNRIKTPGGWCWLTVPLEQENLTATLVKDVKINNRTDWKKKHLASIAQYYRKARFFTETIGIFEEAYGKHWEMLIDIDMFFIRRLMEFLEIDRPLVCSSSLAIEGDRNGRLISLCMHFGADRFYEGKAGAAYIEEERFRSHGIEVLFQEYVHPVYTQLYGEFVPYLSVADLTFNHGKESLPILLSQRR